MILIFFLLYICQFQVKIPRPTCSTHSYHRLKHTWQVRHKVSGSELNASEKNDVFPSIFLSSRLLPWKVGVVRWPCITRRPLAPTLLSADRGLLIPVVPPSASPYWGRLRVRLTLVSWWCFSMSWANSHRTSLTTVQRSQKTMNTITMSW